jgi:LPXTG-motif cell wall-anchored protein
MRKRVLVMFMMVAVIGMYCFGSAGMVFAEDTDGQPATQTTAASDDADAAPADDNGEATDQTTYSVVANYYSNYNNGPFKLDGTAVKVAEKSAAVGSSVTITPEKAWSTFDGNRYGYDASKSRLTMTVAADPSQNQLVVNYYRYTGSSVDVPENYDDGSKTAAKAKSSETMVSSNDSPQTGDTSDIIAWAALGLAAMAALGAFAAVRKKRIK